MNNSHSFGIYLKSLQSNLLQYVDHLLIALPTEDEEDSQKKAF